MAPACWHWPHYEPPEVVSLCPWAAVGACVGAARELLAAAVVEVAEPLAADDELVEAGVELVVDCTAAVPAVSAAAELADSTANAPVTPAVATTAAPTIPAVHRRTLRRRPRPVTAGDAPELSVFTVDPYSLKWSPAFGDSLTVDAGTVR